MLKTQHLSEKKTELTIQYVFENWALPTLNQSENQLNGLSPVRRLCALDPSVFSASAPSFS